MTTFTYVKMALGFMAAAFFTVACNLLVAMGVAFSSKFIIVATFYFLVSAFFAFSVLFVNEIEKRKKKR